MKRTSATRHEMLARNPGLKKYWLSRVLIGPILMGAKLNVRDWKILRFTVITTPMLIAIFTYIELNDTSSSTADYISGKLLIAFFALGWPFLVSAAYGYKNKSKLDTTGAVEVDLARATGQFQYVGGIWGYLSIGVFILMFVIICLAES